MMAGHMARSPSSRVAVSLRLKPELAAKMKSFVRDHAGKPLFLTLSTFAEDAIERHLRLLEAEVEGAARRDRTTPSPNHRR